MQAYLVNPVGFGYIVLLPKSEASFWSRNTAGKFCEAQITDYIQTDLRKYVEKADFQEGLYKTFRKFNTLEHLKRYVLTQQIQSLPELANQVLALKPELMAIIPSIKHPCHQTSNLQVDNLIWLCIRIRKQFKTLSVMINRHEEPANQL